MGEKQITYGVGWTAISLARQRPENNEGDRDLKWNE